MRIASAAGSNPSRGQEASPATDAAIPTLDVHDSGPRGAAALGALQWGLMALLALAPLPLASARPLAWSALAIATALLIGLAAVCELVDPTRSTTFGPLRVPMAMATAVALWAGIQCLPLDIGALQSEIWSGAERALDSVVVPSISVARVQSLDRLLRLLTYAGAFLVAWRVGRRAEGAQALLRAVAAVAVLYSLYGLIVYFSGNQTILWYPKWAYKFDLTSTFVNRNFFGTYVGLGLIATLALMARVLMSGIDEGSFRSLVRHSIEGILRQGLWVTFALVIMGSALLFTHSRGATAATLIGVITLLAAATSAPSLRSRWRIPFVVVVAVAATIVFALNGTGVLMRMASTPDSDLRFDIDSGTWRAIGDHLLAGTGLGTFRFVYAPYQPPSVGLFVDLAHNDYLENILELGVPAAAVFYGMLVLLVARCVRGVFRRRRDAIFPCAALGATALVGSHSAIDFSMQMPAVAVTYAVILGLGVAQSESSPRAEKVRRAGSAVSIPSGKPI